MRDTRFPHEIAAILPGEFFVSPDPMIVYTVLGSCVSACVRDPFARVGGMNHFMLPKPKDAGMDSWGESTRYGSYAMESLINGILKRGGNQGLAWKLNCSVPGKSTTAISTSGPGIRNGSWTI